MAIARTSARLAVPSGCVLGEGPVWDHRTATLYWVDIKAPAVWRLDAEGVRRTDMREPVGFVALTEEPGVLLAGFKSGLSLLDLASGATDFIAAPEPDLPGNRINDGTVGPDGALYFGTMDDTETSATGRFYRWDGKNLVPFGDRAVVTNGPAFSPGGDLIYTVHSASRSVFVHEMARGLPGPAQTFVRFAEEWGYPDGLAVDHDGYVWICHWAGGRITRFAPDGTVDQVVSIPAANVTKCAFGGADLRSLYVTTAKIGCDADPLAGHLFIVDSEVAGLPAVFFRSRQSFTA